MGVDWGFDNMSKRLLRRGVEASYTVAAGGGGGGGGSLPSLTWAPPVLTNPITVVIPDDGYIMYGGLPHVLELTAGQDYIIKIGHLRRTTSPMGGISIIGGRNIHIIGGEIEIIGATNGDGEREALVFHNQTGIVHVEGVWIHGKPLRGFVCDASCIFQFQNCRVDGLYIWNENFGGMHSDTIITWIPPTDIRIDRYTTDHDGTGFAIYQNGSGIYPGRVRYKNVNVRRGATNYGHDAFYWCGTQTRLDFDNVYVETGFQSTGAGDYPALTGYQWSLSDAFYGPVAPDPGAGAGHPVYAITGDGRSNGSYIEFTNPAFDGIYGVGSANARYYYGIPPGGDFVPVGRAGQNYVSPGYAGLQYYVTTTGNDSTGNGSSNAPWKTVKKACDTVTSGTINVAAGTFVETSTINIPNGVSVVGAGLNSTIIQAATGFSPLMQISGTTVTQTLSDFRLDGQTRTKSDYGLKVIGCTNLIITRLDARGFKGTLDTTGAAINVDGATDFVLSYCNILNSGQIGASNTYVSGALGLGDLLRANVFNNTVSTDAGYSVKSTGGTIKDSNFYNNVFTVPTTDQSGWASLCVEFFSTTSINNNFHHNNLNGPLSITGPPQNSDLGTAYGRWHVYKNKWTITGGNQYAIEMSCPSSEIDHNWIDGGLYPLGYFETGTVNRIDVHHNVFDHVEGPAGAWLVSTGSGAPSGLIFRKNTVINRDGVLAGPRSFDNLRDGILALPSGGVMSITGNQISSVPAIGDKLGLNLGACTITGNNFYNMTVNNYADTGSVFTNPLIPLTGAFPAYYTPAANTGYGAFSDGTWSDVGVQ